MLPSGMAYGVKGTEVDQSCFKSITGYIRVSELNTSARKVTEEIHDIGEPCKYQHVDQATGIQYLILETNKQDTGSPLLTRFSNKTVF